MLDPRDRQLLLEALRPPVGHRFDRAVGTTFSLDPTALLAVPLALSAFDIGAEERQPHEDSLALLEAVRRNAARVSLFCQSGRIVAPSKYSALLTYLEKSVVEVAPPRDGFVFHPKVWLVRYSSDAGATYRLLCLTRNLTFDRSWDTVLTLQGPLVDRRNAYAVNHPLGDFVAALPRLATRRLPPRIQRDIELMQREVRRVKFAPPDDFDSFVFVPVGLGGERSWPFPSSSSRGLVVSPFVTVDALRRLPACRDGLTLVSRPESLDALDASALGHFSPCYVLSEMAEPEPTDAIQPVPAGAVDGVTPSSSDGHHDAASPTGTTLGGLHAKLFVFDEGWESRLWTGSTNATGAAFGGNVEFLVELRGKRSKCGVSKVLGAEGKGGLAELLDEYRAAGAPETIDPTARELEDLLETTRRQIAARPLRLTVNPTSPRAVAWHVALEATDSPSGVAPSGVSVAAWPISLSRERATDCDFRTDAVADFGELSLEALTPFIAFRVHAERDGHSGELVFVLNLPMDGEPPGRNGVVLRHMLRRPADLIALLLLLLADDDEATLDALSASAGAPPTPSWQGLGMQGLFESLVRTLARDPARLRAVNRLINDLRRAERELAPMGVTDEIDVTDESDVAAQTARVSSVVPDGFDEIWEPIWQAALQLGVPGIGEDEDQGGERDG